MKSGYSLLSCLLRGFFLLPQRRNFKLFIGGILRPISFAQMPKLGYSGVMIYLSGYKGRLLRPYYLGSEIGGIVKHAW